MNTPNITNLNSNTLREDWIKKHYPEFHNYITGIFEQNIAFKEKLWLWSHEMDKPPVCETCGKPVKFISFGEGYRRFCCGPCASKNERIKQEVIQRNIEKYGVDNPAKTKEIKDKIKQINEEKYGCHPMRLESTHEKIRENCMKKYGVDHFSRLESTKQKIKSTKRERYGDENYTNRDRAKQTCMERYGVDNPQKNKEIRQKSTETFIQRYGGHDSPEIQEKRKRHCIEKYGVDSFSKTDEFKEKLQQTLFERYGVRRITDIPGIHDKARQTCLEKYGVDSWAKTDDFRKMLSEVNKSKMKSRLPELIDVFTKDNSIMYTIRCPHPNCTGCDKRMFETWPMIHYDRKHHGCEVCTILNPVGVSTRNITMELFIQSILDSYNIPYETNNRSLLGGKELDIYLPGHCLAVECNGVYWHSRKEPPYHHTKWENCKDLGIQLLTFWEDQIINKPDIVRNILLSHLGIYNHRIGARQCDLREVPSKESLTFLQQCHLQGPVTGSVRLGLYYDDELVALMVFGHKRTALSNRKHDTWELYRYCCRGGWNVVGGASRLFKYFLTGHPDTEVESFSSNDISDGALYRTLGFEKVGDQMYSYWYIDKWMQRHHRYDYRKNVLVEKYGADPTMTEFEITDGMGLLRIYDTGQQKWKFSR